MTGRCSYLLCRLTTAIWTQWIITGHLRSVSTDSSLPGVSLIQSCQYLRYFSWVRTVSSCLGKYEVCEHSWSLWSPLLSRPGQLALYRARCSHQLVNRDEGLAAEFFPWLHSVPRCTRSGTLDNWDSEFPENCSVQDIGLATAHHQLLFAGFSEVISLMNYFQKMIWTWRISEKKPSGFERHIHNPSARNCSTVSIFRCFTFSLIKKKIDF